MLKISDTALILIDVQTKLAEVMSGKEALLTNLLKLTQGARALNLPVIWTEQIPEKIGPTDPTLAEALTGLKPIPKKSFSCCGEPAFLDELKKTGRRQLLLCGIETHVCVYQTAAHLLAAGYEVEVVADAVSSRAMENKALALEKMRQLGVNITGVEMALFELLRTADHEAFRTVLKIIK